MTNIGKNIELEEFDSYSDAMHHAADAAIRSFSRPLPAVMFEQAGRSYFSTSFPLDGISGLIQFDSAVKGSNDPENRTNRPIMQDHVRSISEYLVESDQYILPGVTLNVRDSIRVFTTKDKSQIKMAVIVIPNNATFFVTDGQHRIKAISDACAKKPELKGDAVAVTIVVEPDSDQIHQDFADCAKTRPIPPALLTLYDRSDELSQLTVEVARDVVFFEKRLEKVGNTVSKRSTNFYTLNHLRMSIASAMTGNSASGGSALSRSTSEMLSSEAGRAKWKQRLLWFYDTLTEALPEWRTVRNANLGHGTLPDDLINFRAGYFHFTGTGLAIMGAVAYCIFNYYDEPTMQQEKVLALAKQIDWRRLGDDGTPNAFWVGTIVSPDGKMVTSRYAAEAAVNKILKKLGIEKKKNETESGSPAEVEPELQTSPA